MLPTARRFVRRLAERLDGSDAPIVVAEPSCASTFRDELGRLLPDDPRAGRVVTLAELLIDAGWQPPAIDDPVVLHGHCHQKATLGLALSCRTQLEHLSDWRAVHLAQALARG